MVTIAITGANAALGYEAARQLALEADVKKVVITARSKDKAEGAVSRLVKDTGKDNSFFESVILDLSQVDSIKAAINSFPAVDRLCLNAGGLGPSRMHSSGNGMTELMVINTIGHAMLVDGLLTAGKLSAGARVVYVGSEVARNLWSFFPFQPNYCGYFAEKDIDWAITKNYNGCGSCCPIHRQLGDYKNAKIIGHMHFANLAKEHPEIHVISTSPGAVGGPIMTERARFPVNYLMMGCPCVFRCMGVTHAFCPSTSQRIGAKRYVDVLTGEPKWKTGSMPMSGKCCGCCCFWSGCGPMADNRPFVAYFKDEALCEKTSSKVREYASKWASSAPTQVTMK